MKILFTRDLNTADSLIESVARTHEVCVLSIRAQELKSRMHATQVVSVSEHPQWLVKLAALYNSQTVPPVYLSDFPASVNKFRPDVLVLMECTRLDLFQALAYKRRNPTCRLVLWTETKRLPRQFLTRLMMRFFLRAVRKNLHLFSHILTYTDAGASFWGMQVRGQVPISVIPAAADVTLFYPDPDKEWMPEGQLRILMNARYVPFKRHVDLLDALVLLSAEGFDFSLTLIGSGKEGRPEVEKMAAERELTNQVSFLDPVPREKARGLYVGQDVVVLPSYNEALGLVIPEAMACGVPTITSDTVGANVYVQEGETGFIFRTYDVNALADCIRRISMPSVLERMGREARVRIESGFTTAALSAKLVRALTHG